jgi:hypothetical protein
MPVKDEVNTLIMQSSQHKEEIGRKRYIVKEIIDVLIPYGSSRGITLPPVH